MLRSTAAFCFVFISCGPVQADDPSTHKASVKTFPPNSSAAAGPSQQDVWRDPPIASKGSSNPDVKRPSTARSNRDHRFQFDQSSRSRVADSTGDQRPKYLRSLQQPTEQMVKQATMFQPDTQAAHPTVQADERRNARAGMPVGRYLVTVTTYDVMLSDNEQPAPIETVRVSAMESQVCQAQFGRQVSVVNGKVSNGRNVSTQRSQVNVGSIVEATVEPNPIGAIFALKFETSRLVGEGTNDSPPDVTTVTLTTTMAVKFDEPTLVGSGSSESPTFVYVTISKL